MACSRRLGYVYINPPIHFRSRPFFLSANIQYLPQQKSQKIEELGPSKPSVSQSKKQIPALRNQITMKFFAIISLLSVGALAAAVAEPEAYADAAADDVLEKRFDCARRVALCPGGHFIQKTSCQCGGQVERCDLWACPEGRRVGVQSKFVFAASAKTLGAIYNGIRF